MRWRVRPAGEFDREALFALWRQVDAIHASLQPEFFRIAASDPRAESALRRALADETQAILVALDSTEVVRGLCHVLVSDTPSNATLVPLRRARVDSLVVDVAFRRRGCGRALMAECERWARHRGAKQLLLTVWAGNDDAEQFYSALGYRAVSRVLGTDL